MTCSIQILWFCLYATIVGLILVSFNLMILLIRAAWLVSIFQLIFNLTNKLEILVLKVSDKSRVVKRIMIIPIYY